MPKIKNAEYNQFIKNGYIDTIDKDRFSTYLDTIKKQKLPYKCNVPQARAVFICSYYSGRRPSEIANLQAQDLEKVKEKSKYYITIRFKTLKGGVYSTIWLPFNKQTSEMYNFCKNRPPLMYCFWTFRSNQKNKVKWTNEKIILVKTDGKVSRENYVENHSKQYERHGWKINYYINLWTGKPAYFWRHNRFSIMAENGATDTQIQFFKGAKDPKSVQPYKHLSKKVAKEITKMF